MMHPYLKQILAALALWTIASTAAQAQPSAAIELPHSATPAASPHWGYEGDVNPEKWSELSPEYLVCKTGKNQSPVNIERAYSTSLEPLAIHYAITAQDIVNNGHTIQVTPGSDADYLQLGDQRYTLKQFHFHRPSENQIKGKSYPLEGHFVHTDKDGHLLVMAVMFELGAKNPQLDQMLDALHGDGVSEHIKQPIDIDALLPKQHDYYRFAGSLTTPPCTEGVTWIVLKHPISLNDAQLKRFETGMHHNNRPVQPLNGRVVVD